jgi:hypothetical protein
MLETSRIKTGVQHPPLHAWTRSAVEQAIEELAGVATWLPAAVAGFDDTQIRTRPAGEASFSLVEHVWHLRDIDAFGFVERVRRTLGEDRPELPDVAGDRLAIERRYREQPLRPALDELLRERRSAVVALRGLSDAQLERHAVLEGVGPIQLGDLVLRWRAHDAEHRAEIEKLAAALRASTSP